MQHLEYVKMSIDERAQHNKKSSRTKSKEQDTSSKSGNDTHVDDADIRPIYDEEPMAKEVPTADSGTDTEPLEQVHNDDEYNVFANMRQHSEQPESTSNTCLVEKDDSNATPDSPDMCDNDIQTDQNTEVLSVFRFA
ncbi:hypothetical protein Tco_0525338 [Tanacetum coccineum]